VRNDINEERKAGLDAAEWAKGKNKERNLKKNERRPK